VASKGKRAYDSSGRQRQAERSRQRVLGAAHALFLKHGYGATTLQQVADRAGVSLPTIYSVFGTKRDLLLAVFDSARHSVSDAELDLDAPFAELPNLGSETIAHRVRLTREGGAPVARIIAQAAGTDRRLAKTWRSVQADRHRRMTELAEALGTRGQLHTTLDVAEAADVLWGLTSNELYGILVLDRGWAPAHYERWLAHILAASLVGQPQADAPAGDGQLGVPSSAPGSALESG
jgi:AcrR family transcriptional regulator